MHTSRHFPVRRAYTLKTFALLVFNLALVSLLLFELTPNWLWPAHSVNNSNLSLTHNQAALTDNTNQLQTLSQQDQASLLPNSNSDLPALPAQACDPDPARVTSTVDDGTCNTFRSAIAAAATTPTKTVTFGLSPDSSIIISPTRGGLTVPAGVTIDGGDCSTIAPGFNIVGNGVSGSGLTLSGNNTLRKLTIGGFTGRQVSIPTTAHSNQLKCLNTQLKKLPVPPSDPKDSAPPIDLTVTTDFFDEVSFLFTGPNAIQTGVVSGTINRTTVAVLRGKVLDRQKLPVAGVKITVLAHPEYGQTFSRADGVFDLAVNGGSSLTVNYAKDSFLPVQRTVEVPWRQFQPVPDVALTLPDPAATSVNLNTLSNLTVVRGSTISDTSGIRRATLFVSPGTVATMTLPSGATQPITNLNIRATEYTVGDTGPAAMPGTLPSNSGYTYATEWSIDQAQTVGALRVDFNQPVVQYLENFLHFTIGQPVPSGYYDRVKGQWLPNKNGQVIKILSITNGLADLDTDGDKVADNGTGLTPAITTAERQQLASLYTAGQELWRVPLLHFSLWDFNWGFGFPDWLKNFIFQLLAFLKKLADPCRQSHASVIECQNQVLGEELNLTGTPFSLHYQSDRVPGQKADYTVNIPLSSSTVPTATKRFEVEISIAGQFLTYSTTNTATNQTYSFNWNGKDAYGRTLQGVQKLKYRVGYVYDGVYLSSAQQPGANYDAVFGHFSYYGTPATGDRTRQEVTLWNEGETSVGVWDNRPLGLGGWSLNIHHTYDPVGQILYLGDGTRRSAQSLNSSVITTIVGTGAAGYNGDNILATQAQIYVPIQLHLAPDGSLYFAEYDGHRIRKVNPQGLITTVAGNGIAGFSGDGGLATMAQINSPHDVTVGPDGSVYIADYGNNRIRKVLPNGTITTVAGGGPCCGVGDGGPATQANLYAPRGVAVTSDGSLYISDSGNGRLRQVTSDGTIYTIKSGVFGRPDRLSIGPDGSIYVGDYYKGVVYRITPDGVMSVVAGGGNDGDGGLATQASLSSPTRAVVGPDGNLYIVDHFHERIRRVGMDGIINTIAGTGTYGYAGDSGPATQAQFRDPYGIDVGPDGSIYIPDQFNYRIRKVSPAFPGLSLTDFYIPSEDGGEAYIFNSRGKHISTRDTTTGATLYQFGYDSAGRLSTVTDVDGLVTTVKRDVNGNPTAIVGPYGQTSTLTLDINGYLASLANPAGESYQMGYTPDGLLTSFTDPNLKTATMTYDPGTGRLTRDQNAAGGFYNLTRIEANNSYSVTMTSAEGRSTTYGVTQNSNGTEQRTNLPPNNLPYQSAKGTDGTRGGASPDGSSANTVLGPDPRFGMQAPLSSSTVITAAPSLVANTTTARTTTLTNPNDPFSLATMNDTVKINNRTYIQSYNASTKTFTTTSPQNRQSTTVINAQGRVTSEQVVGLDPTTYSYDSQGRLNTLTGSSGTTARTTTFSYYASGPGNGYVQTVTDPLLRQVGFNYNPAGRITSQTLPGNRTIAYTYDPKGNLTSLTPPGQPVHSFTYNNVDLPLTYTAPAVPGGGTNQTSYSYNLDKQLTSITFPDAAALSLDYDSAGRVMTSTTPTRQVNYAYRSTTGQLASVAVAGGGPVLSYSYNGSLLASETYSGPIAASINYIYNNNFWLTSQNINGGNIIDFTYDNDGLLTGAGSLLLSRNLQNGLVTGSVLGAVITSLSYNTFGELVGYTASYGGTGFYSVTYIRDKLGRITQKAETISGVTDTYAYSYDSAGRLSQVQKNGTTTATYTYDDNGNPKTGPLGSATVDGQDRLLTYGPNTYTYNPRGDLVSKTTGGQTTSYTYDVESNLLSATLPGGTTSISYIVDGQNRRIGKKVNGTLVQGFLYQDSLRPVAELDGTGAIISRFVYADGSNVPAYMVKGGVTYRLITDQLGSVRLVVNTANGTIAQQMDYDEWGRVIFDTTPVGSPAFQPFGFAGGLYDRDTKLTRFGARDYDAEAGRWTTKDPIGFRSGDTNFYAYVSNSPVSKIDPFGLVDFERFLDGLIDIDTGLDIGIGGISMAAAGGVATAAGAVVAGPLLFVGATVLLAVGSWQVVAGSINATTAIVAPKANLVPSVPLVGLFEKLPKLAGVKILEEFEKLHKGLENTKQILEPIKNVIKYWKHLVESICPVVGSDFGDPNPSVAFG